jgi:hypothetical protein
VPALLLKHRLLLAEGDARQAAQMALKAVEAGADENGQQGSQREEEEAGGQSAMLAMIRCQLEEQQQRQQEGTNKAQLKEARQQLDFLKEAHPDIIDRSVRFFK